MSAPIPVGPLWGLGRGGVGSGAVLSPLASGLNPASLTVDIPLPEVFPIPDAKEFNPSGTIATAAVQLGVAITGATIDIPPANLVIIRGLNISVANMTILTNVTFTILYNNAPIQGYSGISIFPRVTPFIENGLESFIRLKGPGTVQVVFSNIDGGPYTIGAGFNGWFWPEASDARWRLTGL